MSEIIIVQDTMMRAALAEIAKRIFGDMVKVVVDVRLKIMAVGAELHADAEEVLLEQGSHQEDVWGINLYPAVLGEEFIEYDSMINIRPSQGNRSRGVEDAAVRQRIAELVKERVTD